MVRQSVSWWLLFIVGIWLIPLAALGFIDPAPGGMTLPTLDAVAAMSAGTTISVTTAVDELNADGDCSLREALLAANTDTAVDACPAGSGADVVQLLALTYTLALTETKDVTGGDWDITSTLTLQGITTTLTILDAAQMDRVLHVHAGANAVVRDLTLTNGLTHQGPTTGCGPEGNWPCPTEPGGGVYNEGRLLLTQVVVRDNRAAQGVDCGDPYGEPCLSGSSAGGGDGGGIYNAGELTLEHAVVTANKAGNGGNCDMSDYCRGGDGGHGGGIYNQGVFTLTYVTIQSNQAGSPANSWGYLPAYPTAGWGGGIFNQGQLSAIAVTVTFNSGGDGGIYWVNYGPPYCGAIPLPSGFGGGIANVGQMAISLNHIISNTSSRYSNVFSSFDEGGAGIGNDGNLVIDQTTIAGNSTPDGVRTGYRCHGGDGPVGGGIYNRGVMTVTNSTLVNNWTGDGGSMSHEDHDSYFSGAGDGGDGAGIANSGKLWLNQATVTGNQTGRGGFASGVGQPGRGGGVAVITGTVYIQNSIVATNTGSATGGDCFGTLTSHGHNLLVDLRGCTLIGDAEGNRIGFGPRLEPFGDHGGPTWTLPPLPSSPAVDAATCLDWAGAPLAVDQRGEPRPQGEACDIGAVESPYTSTFVIHEIALPLIAGDVPLAPKSP